MQEAFGGVMNIVLIAFFLIIVEGILGLAVNYSKAFKMKNLVISTFEKYEAAGCVERVHNGSAVNIQSSACYKAIEEGAKRIGYSPSQLQCPSSADGLNWKKVEGMYCYAKIDPTNAEISAGKKASYRIVTQVDINIPVIENVFGFTFFQVKGDTRLINIETK